MKKLKLVHILTDISAERESVSISHLERVSNHGIEYIQQINIPYTGDEYLSITPITGGDPNNYKPGHWGAFQSFKKAVLDNFTEDIDGLILCECDCILDISAEEFSLLAERASQFCEKHTIKYLSFGDTTVCGTLQSYPHGDDEEYPEFQITTKVVLAHCVLLSKNSRDYFLRAYEEFSWESPDIWFNEAIWRSGVSSHAIIKKPVAFQHAGFSLIDQMWKDIQ
jgi:hypothetical protein